VPAPANAVYRYRRLQSRRDAHAVAELSAQRLGSFLLASPGRTLAARLGAEVEAPREVVAAEGEASHRELVIWLHDGRLQLSDLVHSQRGWTTFAEAPEFFDDCEDLRVRQLRWARARKAAWVVALTVGVLACWYGLFALDRAHFWRAQQRVLLESSWIVEQLQAIEDANRAAPAEAGDRREVLEAAEGGEGPEPTAGR
jgi:hypothetical protein